MPIYQLVEIDHGLRRHIEEFEAPNDATALERIEGEPRGIRYELWCGDDLIDEGTPRFRNRGAMPSANPSPDPNPIPPEPRRIGPPRSR